MAKRGRAAKEAGKALEREVAKRIGGKRYPADTGGTIDVESSEFVVQCKHVRSLSLAALEALVLQATADGRAAEKDGAVAVKRRAGKETPILWVTIL